MFSKSLDHYWGQLVLSSTLGLIALLFAMHSIQYPDQITVPVSLHSPLRSVTVYPKYAGRLEHFFVKDGDSIQRGQSIALLHTGADYESVMQLKERIVLKGKRNSQLVGWRASTLLTTDSLGYEKFAHFWELVHVAQSTDALRQIQEEWTQHTTYAQQLRDSLEVNYSQLRDSLPINPNEFKHLKSIDNDSINDYKILAWQLQSELELVNNYIVWSQIGLDILLQYILHWENKSTTGVNFELPMADDQSAWVALWIDLFVVQSPTNGHVNKYAAYLGDHPYLRPSDPLLDVRPNYRYFDIKAQGLIDAGAGADIKKGDHARLFLEGHSGYIEAIVNRKWVEPEATSYSLEFIFPQGLNSHLGERIEFNPLLKGHIIIETPKRRLWSRIIG